MNTQVVNDPYNPLTRGVVYGRPFDKGVVLVKPWETTSLFRDKRIAVLQLRFIVFVPPRSSLLQDIEKYLGVLPPGAQYGVFGRWGRGA